MKTPMQFLLEKIENGDFLTSNPKVIGEFIKYNLLDKEKDVITYAYERGFLAGWMHENCKPLTYYNETFNTKAR
jgi:hypothetical protein